MTIAKTRNYMALQFQPILCINGTKGERLTKFLAKSVREERNVRDFGSKGYYIKINFQFIFCSSGQLIKDPIRDRVKQTTMLRSQGY